jgi:predicted DNA-binding WGR domain protein
MAKIRVETSPALQEGEYTVEICKDLNLFDLTGKKAKTQGTSNKFYHAELQVAKSGDQAQIYTMYGATGRIQRREWRWRWDDGTPLTRAEAEKEFNRIIKSKFKKGYEEIDVGVKALGSTEAKKQTKPVKYTNAGHLKKPSKKSALSDDKRQIVDLFFGSQAHFVATTLKCPLGQLTHDQIDKGRDYLNRAKGIVNAAKRLTDATREELTELTNGFYRCIPHDLGAGARGQMDHLILDGLPKIMKKEDDLDTLLDAKSVNAVLKGDADEEAKYKSLNCEFTEVTPGSDEFRFVAEYFAGSKVSHHGYGSSRVIRVWRMARQDSKEQAFLTNAEKIAKACGKNTFAAEANSLSGGKSKLWVPGKRPGLTKDQVKLYNAANVWPCWHGTRSANLVGITRRGLLIRPSGAVYTGSMYGDGKYFAWQSTKSLNYCDGGYWTGGRSGNTKFMFLLDVIMGKQHKVSGSGYFSSPPGRCHSVYAKARRSGYGGVMNDEMITYDRNDKDNQSKIEYMIEVR